ncbi:MAG TPA: serine/threonine-protein kinase [Kofleriaceae bacterium]|nr:serine/threonine-protein kinase [Kofleriaceae bacterium]
MTEPATGAPGAEAGAEAAVEAGAEAGAEAGTIEAALDEIGRQPAGAWPAALRARFPDDPALARQLLAWLHAQRGAAAAPDRGAALDASTRYELGVELDAGATATVWRAYDRKLRRDVAIKVFDPGSSPALDAILGEARAACEVISEHVVRVLDVHDAEPPYLVMELVGEHELRTGALQIGASAATCRPRDLWEAVRWVRDVARGVHDAHLRNVFHRDLKPHNMLITPISRRAKIADFGLAVSNAGQAAANTRSGMVVEVGTGRIATRIAGTPAYMAPEQARGLSITLDPRDPADRATLAGVDIWGLGAIAHDLLSGRPPWRAEGGLELWEVAAAGAPPPALDRTPHGERIPLRLRKIVDRALAIAPADRYASAGELADELQAVLAWRPTSFDRTPARRAALWAKRNPQLSVTAVVAVVLAAMSLAAYATLLHLSDQRAALAAEMQADKDRFAERTRAAQHELATTEANLHTQTDSLRALQHELAEAEDDYHAIVQAKEQALRNANVATRALATVRGDLDIAEKARDLYESFWTRARKEAEDAERDRDAARAERDAARTASDAARTTSEQAIKDRDAARSASARAEHERDDARVERDRDAAARRQAEAEVARLLGELSAALGARSAATPPAAQGSASAPVAPPAKPAAQGSASAPVAPPARPAAQGSAPAPVAPPARPATPPAAAASPIPPAATGSTPGLPARPPAPPAPGKPAPATGAAAAASPPPATPPASPAPAPPKDAAH